MTASAAARTRTEGKKMPGVEREVKKIFDLMSSRLDSDAAKGMEAVIQFNLNGEGGGSYYVEIKDGTCTCAPGTHASPRLTTTMSVSDFVKMSSREADPETLFNNGRLRLVGDMGLAMKMQTLWPV